MSEVIDLSWNPATVLRNMVALAVPPEMLSPEWLAWVAEEEKRCDELVPFPGPQE